MPRDKRSSRRGGALAGGDKITPLIPQQPLLVTITKTADGRAEYMQVMSADQFSVNIVLISPRFTVTDAR
jgi:hypothetical protein